MLGSQSSEVEAVHPAAPRRAQSSPKGRQARVVRAGFIPLLDIAVLVAAREQGFAEREGVRLELVKDVSWANIRDRLAFHQFDVAHMLAPMVVASKLGLGSNPSPTFTPFALGRGGNAITLSVALYRAMQDAAGLDGSENAQTNGRALKLVVEQRRLRGEKPLVFGMTYPFSSHNYEFRFWMGAAGIHPDRDVTMTVVPPPFAADAMAAGAIDGFCVNAPWNVVAVERGIGRIVAVKADIWPSSPEKVLGVRPAWAEANAETLSRLMVALDGAARWCDAAENRPALAAMLADDAYVGAPESLVRPLLLDRLLIDPDGRSRAIPNYLSFHRQAANFPWVSQALWTYSQMVRWGQARSSPEGVALAASAYRPDIYRDALAGRGVAAPAVDARIEGSPEPASVAAAGGTIELGPDAFLDGRVFDPGAIADYIQGFPVRSRPEMPAAGGEL